MPTAAQAYAPIWTDESGTPISGVDFMGVSCTDSAATTTCVAVGENANGLAAVYHGTSTGTGSANIAWQAGTTPGGTAGLMGVNCVDANTCTAVGQVGTILRTTNGGSTWSKAAVPTTELLRGAGCASQSVCVAVGGDGSGIILRTTDGGTTWTKLTGVPLVQTLADVDCPTGTNTCVATAFGGRILRSTDGGATWVTQASTTVYDLVGVSCTTAATCVAVDNAGIIERYASGAWTTVATADDSFGSVSCSGLKCFAVGYRQLNWSSSNGGATWSATPSTAVLSPVTGSVAVLPLLQADLFGVSCTTSRCRAVGSAGRIQKI